MNRIGLERLVMSRKNEQERFWEGEFGDEYTDRNGSSTSERISSRIAMFSKVMRNTYGVCSALEFGANVGLNLRALRSLIPSIELSAVEINNEAVKSLYAMKEVNVYDMSILDYIPDYQRDFVFTKGVLIHISPYDLTEVYEKMYNSTKKYICIGEYYSPSPVELTYRGQTGKLFKRDFAGEMLDIYPDLQLIDYGFVYHRDNYFKQDDITWFLLEKRK